MQRLQDDFFELKRSSGKHQVLQQPVFSDLQLKKSGAILHFAAFSLLEQLHGFDHGKAEYNIAGVKNRSFF